MFMIKQSLYLILRMQTGSTIFNASIYFIHRFSKFNTCKALLVKKTELSKNLNRSHEELFSFYFKYLILFNIFYFNISHFKELNINIVLNAF